MHIAELSRAAVKVDIKVNNDSLTQNQCSQCVTPPFMRVEIPGLRNATELNSDGMVKLDDAYYQTQEAQLPQRDSASATHVFLGSLTDRALH